MVGRRLPSPSARGRGGVRTLPEHVIAEGIVDRPAGAGGWSYSTAIADVAEQAILEPINPENTGRTRWVSAEEMSDFPLHPGLSPPG